MKVIPPVTKQDLKALDQRNLERVAEAKRQLAEKYLAHKVNYVQRKGGVK